MFLVVEHNIDKKESSIFNKDREFKVKCTKEIHQIAPYVKTCACGDMDRTSILKGLPPLYS